MNQIPNIFKINREHAHLKHLGNAKIQIETLLDLTYKKKLRKPEEELIVTSFATDGVAYYLYRYRKNTEESDWSKFLPNELKSNHEFSETKLNLILFMEINFNLYAWVGGNAFWLIAGYVDHYYGLMAYDKIMSLEEDEAVSTKSRGITGARMGVSEQYRDNFRIINYLQFGKIPKELQVKLNTASSNKHFDFLLRKSTDKLQIAIGKSFKINKAIDFNELHQITKRLDDISMLPAQDLISSYIPIENPFYIRKLRDELEDKVWNSIPFTIGDSNVPDGFHFDFCNPNKIDAFYEAEKYQLMERVDEGNVRSKLLDTLFDKNEIYKRAILRASELYPNNKVGIISYLYRLNVQCILGTKTTAVSGFMYHFNAEFQVGKDAVFLIDGRWYSLKTSFINALAAQTERLFKTSRLEAGVIKYKWRYFKATKSFEKEGLYNMQYDGSPGYIVSDTVIVDGIELCDIMRFDVDVIYLIHVKHSFTSRVRELTNQIVISARRLQEAISTKDKTFFNSHFNKVKMKGRSVNNFTRDEFFQKFMTCKPIVVFATASQLQTDLKIEDNVLKYDSNIARFSVTSCSLEVQTNYYEFRTIQIEREFF